MPYTDPSEEEAYVSKGGTRRRRERHPEPHLALSDCMSSWGPELHGDETQFDWGAHPLKFLNILGFPGFYISTFNCSVKMDCCHYNKTLLNPERTAPSVKKSFSLVSF